MKQVESDIQLHARDGPGKWLWRAIVGLYILAAGVLVLFSIMSHSGPWKLFGYRGGNNAMSVGLDLGRLHIVHVYWTPGSGPASVEGPSGDYNRNDYLTWHEDDKRVFQSRSVRKAVHPSGLWKYENSRAIRLVPVTLAAVVGVVFLVAFPWSRRVLREWIWLLGLRSTRRFDIVPKGFDPVIPRQIKGSGRQIKEADKGVN